ncbi:protein psiQ [Drosophila innubila]|uniref:protein psiQ n=1 Tax=Drosophila innubila TaxID=198719 RepID=UPI00148CBB47|nr:protein psiQ [Drosophila innubila]
MQGHKRCIFIGVIIAISLQSSLAANLECSTGTTTATCAEGVSKCFIKRAADGSVTRGCVTDDTCQPPACLTCNTNNCNSFLMCRHCDATQPECATTNATADAYNQLCAANQVCRNDLNGNGSVQRGCGVACASGDTSCKTCNTDNCNGGIYPEDRRLCYQCSGATCNNVNAANLSPCAVYNQKDQKCYTIGTDDKTMQRGCTTDTDAKCPLASTDPNCSFCDSLNGCNNQTFESVLGGCIKCSDADTCIQNQQPDKATNCAASNYTQTENSCYYQLHANGTVSRGCTNELKGTGCLATENCVQCNGTACNVQAGTFSCLTCRSDNYAPCRKAEVGPTKCTNSSLSDPASMQCFSGEWDGVVLRGCLIDLGPLLKYQCENKDDDRCMICKGPNCNDKKYNGAATLQHMGLGLMGLLFLVRNAL